MRTKKNNDLANHTGAVYIKIGIELSCPSNRMQSITKTRQNNNVTDCTGVIST